MLRGHLVKHKASHVAVYAQNRSAIARWSKTPDVVRRRSAPASARAAAVMSQQAREAEGGPCGAVRRIHEPRISAMTGPCAASMRPRFLQVLTGPTGEPSGEEGAEGGGGAADEAHEGGTRHAAAQTALSSRGRPVDTVRGALPVGSGPLGTLRGGGAGFS